MADVAPEETPQPPPATAGNACLQVPRQCLCLLHLRGREVTVYMYNCSTDDVERLGARIDALVHWYNQRFQVGC